MFDTDYAVQEISDSGVPQTQARAIVRKIVDSQIDLATKRDLKELELKLEGELKLNRWMLGAVLASVLSLVIKAFFQSV
jgi:hypothetical protein